MLGWSTKICFKWSILNLYVLWARNKLSKLDILSIFNICLGVENWKCYLRWHVQRSWQNGFLKKRNILSPTLTHRKCRSRLEICQKNYAKKCVNSLKALVFTLYCLFQHFYRILHRNCVNFNKCQNLHRQWMKLCRLKKYMKSCVFFYKITPTEKKW